MLPPPKKKGKSPRTTPTFKEKHFAKAYVEFNGNASKAAKAAYDVKPSQARNLGHQLTKKPIVQETIKALLDKNGLDLETLTIMSRNAINYNLQHGKPSQAVGASLAQFMYKLHNAVPAKQSIHVSVSRNTKIVTKSFDESKKDLEKQTETNKKLLLELNS